MAHSTENNPILGGTRNPLVILSTVSALALAGCFGGGGSSGGGNGDGDDDDSGGSSILTTLPERPSLDSDAGAEELLFYISGEEAFAGLRAINPENPEIPINVSTEDFSGSPAPMTFDIPRQFTPLIEADWNAGNFSLSGIERNWLAARIDGQQRVDATNLAGTASEDFGEPLFRFDEVTQSPGNPDAARLSVSDATDNEFIAVSPFNSEGDVAARIPWGEYTDTFPNTRMSVRAVDNLEPSGWFVADGEDGLAYYNADGELDGRIVGDESVPGSVTDFVGIAKVGEIMPDGSYYVQITHNDESRTTAFFRLKPTTDPDEPWELERVNVPNSFGSGGYTFNTTSQGNAFAYGEDGSLFFAAILNTQGAGSNEFGLFRLEGTTLTQVEPDEAAGANANNDILFRGPDSLVWFTAGTDGQTIREVSLDGESVETIADTSEDRSDFGGELTFLSDYDTPVHGHRDGWIYYNVVDNNSKTAAVARNLNGGEYFAIEDAKWIGVSTDGSLGEGAFLDSGRLSEVFLVKPDTESDRMTLGAVEAADPEAGMVNLGMLPTGTAEVSQAESSVGEYQQDQAFAAGPHRLFQVRLDTGDYQVIYVDTRAADSLVEIGMPAGNYNEPIPGY